MYQSGLHFIFPSGADTNLKQRFISASSLRLSGPFLWICGYKSLKEIYIRIFSKSKRHLSHTRIQISSDICIRIFLKSKWHLYHDTRIQISSENCIRIFSKSKHDTFFIDTRIQISYRKVREGTWLNHIRTNQILYWIFWWTNTLNTIYAEKSA